MLYSKFGAEGKVRLYNQLGMDTTLLGLRELRALVVIWFIGRINTYLQMYSGFTWKK